MRSFKKRHKFYKLIVFAFVDVFFVFGVLLSSNSDIGDVILSDCCDTMKKV